MTEAQDTQNKNTTHTQGLEDQLLAEVVRHERPDLEQQRDSLVLQISEGQATLKAIEDRILSLLANAASGPAILDDETLIQTLAASKKTSEEVNAREICFSAALASVFLQQKKLLLTLEPS